MTMTRSTWACLVLIVGCAIVLAAQVLISQGSRFSHSASNLGSVAPEGHDWSVESSPNKSDAESNRSRSLRDRKETPVLALQTPATETSTRAATQKKSEQTSAREPSATKVAVATTNSVDVVPSPPGPESWATFRNGYGQLGIAKTTLAPQPDVLWKFKTSEGMVGCAAIVGNQVYVPCLNGELVSIDRATGKPQWSYCSVVKTKADDFAPGFKAAPTVSADTVYVGDEEGTLHALDRRNGKLKWKFATGAEIAGAVALVRDKIVFGSHDSYLYCLNATDHSVVWKFQTENFVNCSTAIEGNYTFIAGCDTKVRVIDIRNGKQVYEVPLGEGAYLIASPAVSGNMLYVGTHDGRVVGVDWMQQKVVWTYSDQARPLEYRSSAAVTDKFVILGGYDKLLHCLDRKTGAEVWNFPTRGHVESSPVVVDDRVYFGSGDGNVYAVTLKDGKKTWQFRAGHSITSSPAVGEKCLVIGTDGPSGTVYCFGSKAS